MMSRLVKALGGFVDGKVEQSGNTETVEVEVRIHLDSANSEQRGMIQGAPNQFEMVEIRVIGEEATEPAIIQGEMIQLEVNQATSKGQKNQGDIAQEGKLESGFTDEKNYEAVPLIEMKNMQMARVGMDEIEMARGKMNNTSSEGEIDLGEIPYGRSDNEEMMRGQVYTEEMTENEMSQLQRAERALYNEKIDDREMPSLEIAESGLNKDDIAKREINNEDEADREMPDLETPERVNGESAEREMTSEAEALPSGGGTYASEHKLNECRREFNKLKREVQDLQPVRTADRRLFRRLRDPILKQLDEIQYMLKYTNVRAKPNGVPSVVIQESGVTSTVSGMEGEAIPKEATQEDNEATPLSSSFDESSYDPREFYRKLPNPIYTSDSSSSSACSTTHPSVVDYDGDAEPEEDYSSTDASSCRLTMSDYTSMPSSAGRLAAGSKVPSEPEREILRDYDTTWLTILWVNDPHYTHKFSSGWEQEA